MFSYIFEKIKRFTARTPFSPIAKRVYYWYLRVIGKRHSLQDIETSNEDPLLHLGTDYGGWTFVEDDQLYGSTILSAGLGEDASFDIEFAEKYQSKMIIVDPTPRAVQHFEDIKRSIGENKTESYSEGGKQPIAAYELSNIDSSQLSLVRKALWKEKTKIKFYKPDNESHVSHSIINWQHDYNNDSEYIKVRANTVFSILEDYNIDKNGIEIVKLDIEGAEIEVLSQMVDNGLLPRQILVEFDKLHNPSEKGFKRVDKVHRSLLEEGYELLYTDGNADFLYYNTN